MNREQARCILWALGTPSSEDQRRNAIGVVLDLWQEVVLEPVVTAEQPAPNQWVLDSIRQAKRTPMNEANAEIERLRQLAEGYEVQLVDWSQLWRRIEKLVGREFTTPESTIDRVAFLAEVEKVRPTQQRFDELQADRDALLAAARAVGQDETVPVQRTVAKLTDVVETIDKNDAREDS